MACLAAFMSLSAATPLRAVSPLDDLITPGEGKSACFTRVYDEAHLRNHPKQTTTAMTVWLKYRKAAPDLSDLTLGLGLSISRRGDEQPFFAQGGCLWVDGANRNVQGKRLIKAFTKDAGADCMMSARPDVFDTVSAQEGGYLIIDAGKERDTLTLYLDNQLIMVKRTDRAKQLDMRFGSEDRVFLLRKADAKVCEFVERALSR